MVGFLDELLSQRSRPPKKGGNEYETHKGDRLRSGGAVGKFLGRCLCFYNEGPSDVVHRFPFRRVALHGRRLPR